MRAAIYARISSDREGGGLGVARQIKDCKALCAKQGWTVVSVLEDNDISAWSKKPRPGYDSMLDLIREGHVDVVVCWHTDRLTRSARDLEDVIEACERHDVTVHAVQVGNLIDLSTAAGQLQARIVGAVARHESSQKAERIRRKHQELAESGKGASLHMSYGYRRVGAKGSPIEIVPEEAAIIRDLAKRLLAGESIRSLTTWLNANDVPTKRGNSKWSSSTVRQILTSGRLCGWREWTPRTPPTKDAKKGWDGKPRRGHAMGDLVAQGAWEPILTKDETLAIRALVSDPSRKSTKRRHYLLSAGILRCGKCGKSMNHKVEVVWNRIAERDENGNVVKDEKTGRTKRVKDRTKPPKKTSRYACIAQNARGCGGISIACPELDAFVTEAVFVALAGCDLSTDDEQPSDDEITAIRRQVDAAESRLVEVGNDFADGLIGRAEWLSMRSRIEAKVADLRTSLSAADERTVLLSLPSRADDLREHWRDMDLERQRSVVQALIDRVIIHPAVTRAGSLFFDPRRIEIVWRA